MFKGMFEHQLDDKNRIRIPSKFKKELTGENGEKSYSFFRGMNNCICVMADELLAPEWSRKKVSVINDIDKLLFARDSFQGKSYRK